VVLQKQKLLAAGAVLAAGFGLALPFQRPRDANPIPTPAPPQAAVDAAKPQTLAGPVVLDGQFSPPSSAPASLASTAVPADAPEASTADSAASSPPAAASPTADAAADEIITARPVFDAEDVAAADEPSSPGHRIHVIHNGDTLERLAERYLGDGLRALELFDLNRDLLENPHLLPIGAELRIPKSPEVSGD
jgi:nucleoid-associated protein YgaU